MIETTANLDDDGYINSDYYRNASLDIIQREAEERGLDVEKLSANQLVSLLRACYNILFKPQTRGKDNNACNIPYNEENITRLFLVYTELAERFGCIPSVYTFTRYSGIEDDTVYKYVTHARLDVLKTRRNYIQNALSNTTVGQITLANNDADTGLMYTAQNMIQSEQIKQGLSVSDLYKLPSRQVAQKD